MGGRGRLGGRRLKGGGPKSCGGCAAVVGQTSVVHTQDLLPVGAHRECEVSVRGHGPRCVGSLRLAHISTCSLQGRGAQRECVHTLAHTRPQYTQRQRLTWVEVRVRKPEGGACAPQGKLSMGCAAACMRHQDTGDQRLRPVGPPCPGAAARCLAELCAASALGAALHADWAAPPLLVLAQELPLLAAFAPPP